MSGLTIVNGEADTTGVRITLSNGDKIELSDMDAVNLVALLNRLLEETSSRLSPEQKSALKVHRVELREMPETLFLRLFVSDHLAHAYEVDRGTNLAAGLMAMGAVLERHNLSKATPGSEKKQ